MRGLIAKIVVGLLGKLAERVNAWLEARAAQRLAREAGRLQGRSEIEALHQAEAVAAGKAMQEIADKPLSADAIDKRLEKGDA